MACVEVNASRREEYVGEKRDWWSVRVRLFTNQNGTADGWVTRIVWEQHLERRREPMPDYDPAVWAIPEPWR